MKAVGKAFGVPGLRHALYPGTIDFDTDEDLRKKLDKSLLDEIIDALTKEVNDPDASK